MGGVGKNDQTSHSTPSQLQGKNGGVGSSMILLIDRAVYNSYFLEEESPHCAASTLKQFHIELAKKLVGNFCSRRKRGRHSDEGLQLTCHIKRHFPSSCHWMKMARGRKGVKFAMTVELWRPATFAKIVTQACVQHIASNYFISLEFKPCDQEISSCRSVSDTIWLQKLEKAWRPYFFVPYSVYIDWPEWLPVCDTPCGVTESSFRKYM